MTKGLVPQGSRRSFGFLWALTWAIPWDKQKSGTGAPLHTKEPVTVASFRTWRVWRENVARNRCLTHHTIKRSQKTGIDSRHFDYHRVTLCLTQNAPSTKS